MPFTSCSLFQTEDWHSARVENSRAYNNWVLHCMLMTQSVISAKVFNVARNMISHYRFIFQCNISFHRNLNSMLTPFSVSVECILCHSVVVKYINSRKFVFTCFYLVCAIFYPQYLVSERKDKGKKWERGFFKCSFSGDRGKHFDYFCITGLSFPKLSTMRYVIGDFIVVYL